MNINKELSAVTNNIHRSLTLHDSFVDHYENRFEHHLIMGDRSSMWHSLELRFPYLDHDIVEGLLSLPNNWIIRNGMSKYILRKAVKSIVPERIGNRKDKIGFSTPDDEWFRTDIFRVFILDILNSKRFKERGYLNVDKAIRKYNDHLNRKCNICNEIWKWINLELWFNYFIDHNSINLSNKLCPQFYVDYSKR